MPSFTELRGERRLESNNKIMNQAPDEESDECDPTSEELDLIRKATSTEAEEVDALILKRCTGRWGKVAMVVGSLLEEFDTKYPHLPYVYIQVRMLDLEHRRLLETNGDIMQVRASEVRLANPLK